MVKDDVSLVCAAGVGMFFPESVLMCGLNGSVDRGCKLFCCVLGPFQTVPRAELRVVNLALQASTSAHVGGDSLNFVRHVRHMIDGPKEVRPFPFIKKKRNSLFHALRDWRKSLMGNRAVMVHLSLMSSYAVGCDF